MVHGEERGRTIGFPTANLSDNVAGYLPVDGVYAGWLVDLGSKTAESDHAEAASDGISQQFDSSSVDARLADHSPYRHLELCGIALTYVYTGANNGKNRSNLYINGKKCFEKLLSLAEGMQTKLCILPKIKTFRCTVETHLNLC